MRSKYYIISGTVVLALLLLAGCMNSKGTAAEVSGEDMIEKLGSGADFPASETIRLNAENFEAYAFLPYDEKLEAYAADALVNITPHSIVVIHSPEGKGGELAKEVLANADPRKWICVEAEKVSVGYTDHYVVLAMSYQDTVDKTMRNFKAMEKDLNDGTVEVMTK